LEAGEALHRLAELQREAPVAAGEPREVAVYLFRGGAVEMGGRGSVVEHPRYCNHGAFGPVGTVRWSAWDSIQTGGFRRAMARLENRPTVTGPRGGKRRSWGARGPLRGWGAPNEKCP